MRRLAAVQDKKREQSDAKSRRALVDADPVVDAFPGVVTARAFEQEAVPEGGDVDVFGEGGPYAAINKARLDHLASLGLDLSNKRVADVGAGIGDLTPFFIERHCKVVAFDARPENVDVIKSKYPEVDAHVADAELSDFSKFGTFDIVFAYGLLYHLENPVVALRNLASLTSETLLIETMICDHEAPLVRLVDETKAFDQAMQGLGSRPTPSYIVMGLQRAGLPFIYGTRRPPRHIEYRFEWRNDLAIMRGGHPLRAIFVGARTQQTSDALFDALTR